jgi:proline iminopeptidase
MDNEPTHAWQVLYPPLQIHRHGWLDVGDGHDIYWEECGNPSAPAALFVHGGPGVGCAPHDRRWFDPARWRIVLFDQRGAGRSRPLGSLRANTTPHLVSDIEALRVHLNVPHWLVFGGSWGATLALAYAERHPAQVLALVLRGVFTATGAESRWLYSAAGAATTHPLAWQRLRQAAVPSSHLLDGLSMALNDGTSGAALRAACAWWQWEQDLMEPDCDSPAHASAAPPAIDHGPLFAAARIGVHYARRGYFVAEGQLLAEASRLRDILGAIVQGEEDTITPAQSARDLHRAWPASQLHVVPRAGHASSHPVVAQRLIAATDALCESVT